MPPDYSHASKMCDHWWWRPGWRPGRRFYTWHLTFEDQPALHRLVSAYQERLASFSGLRPVPLEWLHLTMQGIGFTDEVSDADVARVVAAVQQRLAGVPQLRLAFGPAVVFTEAIVLPPARPEDVATVRTAIRAGIADVYGQDNVPESAAGYRPHVTVAYSTTEQPAGPVIAAIDAERPEPATIPMPEALLIELGRDEAIYRWHTVGSARVGAPPH